MVGNGTGRRLVLHGGLLLLVLIGGAAATRVGPAVTSDEGAAAYQAVLLNRGTWTFPRTLPELDPEGERQPFFRAEAGPRGQAPYAAHPLYPVLLSLSRRVWPVGGLVAVSVLGTWLAALLAALLAEEIRPRSGPVALWLVGALSPLAIDSTWVLAHAPAAATAAATVLAAWRVLRQRSWNASTAGWLVLVAAAGGATVGLRSEGAVLLVALAVGVLTCRRPDLRSVVVAATAVAAGGFARVAEAIARSDILGPGSAVAAPPVSDERFLAARWSAFRSSWIHAGGGDESLLLMAAALLAVAALAHRLSVRWVLVTGLCTAASLAAVAWLVIDPDLVPGLLPASAWLGAGAIVLGRRAVAPGMARLLAVTTVVGALGILATQYAGGGGVEWGGRYYALLLPGAGALVVGAWPRDRQVELRPLVAGLALVAAVSSVGGVAAVGKVHRATDAVERAILDAAQIAPPGRHGDGDDRPVLLTYQVLWPQLFWRSFDDLRWVGVSRTDARCVLADLRLAGFRRIVVVENRTSLFRDLAPDLGWREDPAAPGSPYAHVLDAVGPPPDQAAVCRPP